MTAPTPTRRWFRWSLRTLFVVIALTASIVGTISIVIYAWLGSVNLAATSDPVYREPVDAWWRLPKDSLQPFIQNEIARASRVEITVTEAGPKGSRRTIAHIEVSDPATLREMGTDFVLLSPPGKPEVYSSDRLATFAIIGDSNIQMSFVQNAVSYGPPNFRGDKTAYSRSHSATVSYSFVDNLEKLVGARFSSPRE